MRPRQLTMYNSSALQRTCGRVSRGTTPPTRGRVATNTRGTANQITGLCVSISRCTFGKLSHPRRLIHRRRHQQHPPIDLGLRRRGRRRLPQMPHVAAAAGQPEVKIAGRISVLPELAVRRVVLPPWTTTPTPALTVSGVTVAEPAGGPLEFQEILQFAGHRVPYARVHNPQVAHEAR